jgi:FKBP-type peptidyl-prolyl cis-trans isomerase SlyD
MKIDKDTAVTLRYRVSDPAGTVLDESQTPMSYLHGGYGNTFPKLEEALQGQSEGYQVTLDLQPQDAFGVRDDGLMQSMPKAEFPPGVKLGGHLRARTKDGRQHDFTVVKIKGDKVYLDGNHPMAGRVLRFHLSVLEVRQASAEEIAHGHVHGAHGHHH